MRSSHTGILILLNKVPVIWYSKQHNTVRLVKFGSEFVARRTAQNMVLSMRYKLRIIAVLIDV